MAKYVGTIYSCDGQERMLAQTTPGEFPTIEAAKAAYVEELASFNPAIAFCLKSGVIRVEVVPEKQAPVMGEQKRLHVHIMQASDDNEQTFQA